MLLALDRPHHEAAGLKSPIDVPLDRLVAAVQQHFILRRAPIDRILVLFCEVTDAAEVEDHDRLQRMLSRRTESAVVDKLNDRKEAEHRRDEQNSGSAQRKLAGPDQIGRKDRRREQGIRPQQHAYGNKCEREQLSWQPDPG